MKLLPSPTVPVGLQASMALGTAAVRLGTGRGPHGPRIGNGSKTLSYIWNVPTYIMGLYVYIYMAYICLWIINHLLSGMHIQVGVPFGFIKRG